MSKKLQKDSIWSKYDIDNDGVGDNGDGFPYDECATKDMDGDGKPDLIKENCNTSLELDDDIDGDGYNNTLELILGTNPRNAASKPLDYDNDGDRKSVV